MRYRWHTSTYVWYTTDMWVHTSEKRMIYKYIGVTYRQYTSAYGWHMSTYEWHTVDMQVSSSDIRMIYDYIQMTFEEHMSKYEWNTDDFQVTYKLMKNIKLYKVFIALRS